MEMKGTELNMENKTINNQSKTENQVIYLEREFVRANGRDYANYFVRGTFNVRGQDVEKRIRMDVPKNDNGMYDVLDMVFEDRNKVELLKIAKVNRDMTTGKKTITYRYEVANVDDDLRARVVPSGESNNALLDKLFKDLQKEAQVEDDELDD